MKQIEKLALTVSVLSLGINLAIPFVFQALDTFWNLDEASQSTQLGVNATVRSLLHGFVPLVIGFWLYTQAPRHQLNKWIWALFGLLFNLNAVILFYLYLLHVHFKTPADSGKALT